MVVGKKDECKAVLVPCQQLLFFRLKEGFVLPLGRLLAQHKERIVRLKEMSGYPVESLVHSGAKVDLSTLDRSLVEAV